MGAYDWIVKLFAAAEMEMNEYKTRTYSYIIAVSPISIGNQLHRLNRHSHNINLSQYNTIVIAIRTK